MLMPQSHRRAICTALFTEGVLIAKKDFNAKKHVNIPGVTNLEVIKALQSLNSRGFVRTKFSWQYYYYFLTAEGVAHLR
ncbi:Plectin/S10, partial [Caulochytrium protostelioides]